MPPRAELSKRNTQTTQLLSALAINLLWASCLLYGLCHFLSDNSEPALLPLAEAEKAELTLERRRFKLSINNNIGMKLPEKLIVCDSFKLAREW